VKRRPSTRGIGESVFHPVALAILPSTTCRVDPRKPLQWCARVAWLRAHGRLFLRFLLLSEFRGHTYYIVLVFGFEIECEFTNSHSIFYFDNSVCVILLKMQNSTATPRALLCNTCPLHQARNNKATKHWSRKRKRGAPAYSQPNHGRRRTQKVDAVQCGRSGR
jgi:hypothetical protein